MHVLLDVLLLKVIISGCNVACYGNRNSACRVVYCANHIILDVHVDMLKVDVVF
jgi:hypothetical protein